jgi:long-chain acyl-CoA synthetase
VRPDDLALLQYTGGTTGTPKGAMLTHRNLVANTLQAAAWFPGLREGGEVLLGAVPLFHAYGLTGVLLLGVAAAAEIVLLPRPRPLGVVLEAVQRFRPTLFPGVPTLYAGLVDHPRVADYDLRTGTLCLSGAAPLPASLVERFEAISGGRLVEGYGLTETSPLTHGNPVRGERREGSIGLPVPSTDARVVSLETGEPLPPGRDGEIEVRGPQVMRGYWNRPAETAEALRDGWFRTGDIGRMDEDGFFYVVDRRKEMIDASGFKVFPREVEEVLLLHPAVSEAVVAGVPDPYRGETVKAFVVLRPGASATAAEIEAFCRLHLAAFKIPRQVEFRTELPKSMVGKYLRRVLVEEERSRLDGTRAS